MLRIFIPNKEEFNLQKRNYLQFIKTVPENELKDYQNAFSKYEEIFKANYGKQKNMYSDFMKGYFSYKENQKNEQTLFGKFICNFPLEPITEKDFRKGYKIDPCTKLNSLFRTFFYYKGEICTLYIDNKNFCFDNISPLKLTEKSISAVSNSIRTTILDLAHTMIDIKMPYTPSCKQHTIEMEEFREYNDVYSHPVDIKLADGNKIPFKEYYFKNSEEITREEFETKKKEVYEKEYEAYKKEQDELHKILKNEEIETDDDTDEVE